MNLLTSTPPKNEYTLVKGRNLFAINSKLRDLIKGINFVSNTLSPKEVLFSGINQVLVVASHVPPANPFCGS